MEFNKETKEKIKKAKIDVDSIDNLSEKEREILFGKIIDRILGDQYINLLIFGIGLYFSDFPFLSIKSHCFSFSFFSAS